jgi:glycosyltransferase involved in cell wall biosynthesis
VRLAESSMGKDELPMVTIVTPTYNQADYLSETIDSVLSQDYPNIEYIVIDDGSTDETREVLKRYDERVYWESQENIGQAATLNKGWSMASGDIIGYLSSDDLLKPEAITELVHCMLGNTEAILVYPDFDLIDASGEFIRNFETPDYDYRNMILNLVCYPGPGALFWKKYFDVTGGWNRDLQQVPDFEYWLRLSQHGDFKRMPKILSSSRIHEDSQSFKVVTFERAMEPVSALVNLLDAGMLRLEMPDHPDKALASAHLLSFRLLLRSRFYVASIKNLYNALSLRPGLIVNSTFWKIAAAAALSRTYYRKKYST